MQTLFLEKLKISAKMSFLSSCLLLCSSLSAWAMPSEVNQLAQELSPKLERFLSQELHREKIGVEITPTELSQKDAVYRLGVSNHVLRDTVFDLRVRFDKELAVIEGRVFSAAEYKLLVETAEKVFSKGVRIHVEHFPYAAVEPDYAITTQPGSSLYVKPIAQAGDNLATQVRLGTPLEILEYSGDKQFALVRILDDGYIAWIQRSHLLETGQAAFEAWQKNRQVLIMRTLNAPQLLYFGTRLRLIQQNRDHVLAALPGGKQIKLASDDVVIEKGPPQSPDLSAVIKTAHQYLPKSPQGGGAYLWGGTFGKTLDCSGFMQTIFRVNHVYLPRDADQQMGFTQRVGNTLAQLSELKPGDLVFFSGNRKYPTHVGLYLGKGKIIHSSPKGPYSGIKISTLQGGGEYDKFLQSIYFGGGRVTRSL